MIYMLFFLITILAACTLWLYSNKKIKNKQNNPQSNYLKSTTFMMRCLLPHMSIWDTVARLYQCAERRLWLVNVFSFSFFSFFRCLETETIFVCGFPRPLPSMFPDFYSVVFSFFFFYQFLRWYRFKMQRLFIRLLDSARRVLLNHDEVV